jgi:hypothetical protein
MNATPTTWTEQPTTVTVQGITYRGTKHIATVHGVEVQIDVLNGHVGFAYKIYGTTYGDGGRSLARTKSLIPGHVQRNLERRDAARIRNKERMREIRTIGSNEGT